MIISGEISDSTKSLADVATNVKVAEGSTSVCTITHANQTLLLRKTLKPEYADDEMYRQLFNKEFNVGASLNNLYITKYISLCYDQACPSLLMEYVEGATLQQMLADSPQWFASRNNIFKLMEQLLNGLSCMHEHQAVHLDLSLTNIMLTSINHDVRIIDLGYCYSPAHPSRIGVTAHYGAPELRDPQAPIDARADIYSFGRIMQEVLEVARLQDCKLPRWLVKLVARCCNNVPDQRPDSAAQLIDELRRLKTQGFKLRLWAMAVAFVVVLVSVMACLAVKDYDSASYSCSGDTYTVNGVSFKMVPVEGGTFTMGYTPCEYEPIEDETPAYRETVSSFEIGETEVTQALWNAVMNANFSRFRNDSLPVERVNWQDCQEFIKRLNDITGEQFRLPTEAEWEFAARGGNKSRGYIFSGSNNIDDVAWHKDNADKQTHPVATKRPNELGIYDMSGNVWEWCQDKYYLYSTEGPVNPNDSIRGEFRMSRGGSWRFEPTYHRPTYRNELPSYYANYGLGFRLAK